MQQRNHARKGACSSTLARATSMHGAHKQFPTRGCHQSCRCTAYVPVATVPYAPSHVVGLQAKGAANTAKTHRVAHALPATS
eukprot:7765608-Alexandrium_andersonii.AAC.1